MKIFRLLFILIIFPTAGALQAEALPEIKDMLRGLDSELVEALILDSDIFRYDEEFSGITYMPDVEGRSAVENIHRTLEPEVMVEALYSIPYPDGYIPGSGELLEKVYKLSHEVSSISGVKYYSVREQGYSVLFTDVYAVNNAEERKRIPNPRPDIGYSDESVFLHMKENALGKGYYRMDYRKRENYFTIEISNETALGFIIPAVDPQDMIIYLQIIPCSDEILIYGYCGVVLQNDPIVHLMLNPYYAFYRRMTAMETWLYNSLHGTDMLPPLLEPRP